MLFFAGRFRELDPHPDRAHWVASVDCPDMGWFGEATRFAPLRPAQLTS
ncbi:hypothetical protein [Amycolatopsis suaedae]|nr:hypothetical protein [Amycolatopsis suaedae]